MAENSIVISTSRSGHAFALWRRTGARDVVGVCHPCRGKSCHIDGDVGVTQTTSKNLFKETSCLGLRESEALSSRITAKGLSKGSQSTSQRVVASERFHVKTI